MATSEQQPSNLAPKTFFPAMPPAIPVPPAPPLPPGAKADLAGKPGVTVPPMPVFPSKPKQLVEAEAIQAKLQSQHAAHLSALEDAKRLVQQPKPQLKN